MKKIAIGCLLLISGSGHASEPLLGVDALLQKASRALQEETYSGRLTYEFGTVLETLEVVHVVKDGIEWERIHHLNGVEREFLRSGKNKDCVTLGGFLLRGGRVDAGGADVSLAQHYHFYIRGDDRIAGRAASVVQLDPKDEHRYGMTLAVDKQSGLPLMSLILSGSDNALERFQFVELDIGMPIDDSALQPTHEAHATLDGKATACQRAESAPGAWHASWVPGGFLLSDSGTDPEAGDFLTYTDGLSSFSLFISPKGGDAAARQGVARRGATVAVMSTLLLGQQPRSIVLVGEVPVATAQRIVASVKPVP